MAEAQVSLTAEIVIEPVKGKIEKTYDKNTGLNLMVSTPNNQTQKLPKQAEKFVFGVFYEHNSGRKRINGISPAFKFKILRKVSDIDGNYQSFAPIFAGKGQQIAVQRQLAITSVSQDF